MPDLIAGALGGRDIEGAIRLMEDEKERGTFSVNDTFLLTYLYCLNGSVEKAEALAAQDAGHQSLSNSLMPVLARVCASTVFTITAQ